MLFPVTFESEVQTSDIDLVSQDIYFIISLETHFPFA